MSDETHRSSFGGVILRGAKIGGQVALIGANVETSTRMPWRPALC
jgi:hypothetical protein